MLGRVEELGWPGLGLGLGWAGLGWAGLLLGWAGLGWAGLGWAGLGWAGLAARLDPEGRGAARRAGRDIPPQDHPDIESVRV